IVLIRYLSSVSLANTSSLRILSLQLIFSNPLHNHTSNASNLLVSSCNNVHVSHPYNTTGHTNTFTILFFNVLLNPSVNNNNSNNNNNSKAKTLWKHYGPI